MNARLLSILLTILVIGPGCSTESSEPLPVNQVTSEAPDNTSTDSPSPAAATPDGNPTTDTPTVTVPDEGTTTTVPSVGNNNSSGNLPTISFQGSSLGGTYNIDDSILLDASYSTVEGGTITSFLWEQVDNNNPMVALTGANTAKASFPASADINGTRLNFKVTVTTSNGDTATSDLFYSWKITVPEPVTPVISVVIGDGYYIHGKTGDFYAQSAESLFVANQVDFAVDHINPATNTVINSYPLTAMPTQIEYVASTNSLYVGLSASTNLIKINLDTGQQTSISATQMSSMATSADGRVYFVTHSSSLTTGTLKSVGDDDIPIAYGVVGGALIAPNPITNEIVVAQSGVSPASVYRYTFHTNGNLISTQLTQDLGSNVRDLALSEDGLRLAVMAGGGNGSGYTIHDIEASDLTVSSGAWDTGPYPASGDFSKSGALFAASNTSDLMIFDAVSHTLTEEHNINENVCGLNYYDLTDVQFSEDDKHVYARLDCGFDNEKSVFFYYAIP